MKSSFLLSFRRIGGLPSYNSRSKYAFYNLPFFLILPSATVRRTHWIGIARLVYHIRALFDMCIYLSLLQHYHTIEKARDTSRMNEKDTMR